MFCVESLRICFIPFVSKSLVFQYNVIMSLKFFFHLEHFFKQNYFSVLVGHYESNIILHSISY